MSPTRIDLFERSWTVVLPGTGVKKPHLPAVPDDRVYV